MSIIGSSFTARLNFRFNLRAKFILMLGCIVAISLSMMFIWLFRLSKENLIVQVDAQARALLQQIVLTRQWIADQGGLYIEKRAGTRAHPLLSRFDIRDAAGKVYVFRNPAMITRELSEYSQSSKHYRLHLTSLQLVNPENSPSDFERAALLDFDKKGFDKSKDGISQIATENGALMYHRIIPLRTEQGCLKCHSDQGYKVGDIRGGLSIAIPMDETAKAIKRVKIFLVGAGIVFVSIVLGTLYIGVWLLVLKPLGHLHQAVNEHEAVETMMRAYLATGDELEDLSHAFKEMLLRMTRTYEGGVKALASAIEARDPYTKGHTDRVVHYSLVVAKEMGLSDEQLKRIEMGAVLHDVGKIGVPDTILRKPGPLNEEERRRIEEHPSIGANILYESDFLVNEIPAVLYHHERYDGKGYPAHLKEKDIPLIARIVAIADSFDAMTSDRPYRKAMDKDASIAEIEKCSGKQFDPEVADAFIRVLKKDIVK
ncbi:MAG: DUF3365 domain-containing protein [Nitrospirae bacterium]|nr:DUF3365 domain-containing protein [Nitrospirota bacterium]